METNPYAPPKACPTPAPKNRTTFQRASAHQSKTIYLGLAVAIGFAILGSFLNKASELLMSISLGISAVAGIIVVLAICMSIPLTIWGIIDGYREGQNRNR